MQALLWEGPANSLCQLFIILLANLSLASRLVHRPVHADSMLISKSSIHGLTKSRVQSVTVAALSTVAFVFGMVTIVTTWRKPMCVSLFGFAKSPLTSFEGPPRRIHDTHHLSGTQHKLWLSVTSHVCLIILPLVV